MSLIHGSSNSWIYSSRTKFWLLGNGSGERRDYLRCVTVPAWMCSGDLVCNLLTIINVTILVISNMMKNSWCRTLCMLVTGILVFNWKVCFSPEEGMILGMDETRRKRQSGKECWPFQAGRSAAEECLHSSLGSISDCPFPLLFVHRIYLLINCKRIITCSCIWVHTYTTHTHIQKYL